MSTLDKTRRDGALPPAKRDRLQRMIECVRALPPARSGLEAFAQITNVLNHLEDQVWGADHYAMPRSYEGGVVTDRLYGSHAESFETVQGFSGVVNMVHTKEFVFVSRTGAIEIQKDTGESEELVHFETRRHAVLFSKPDAYGRAVWDDQNRDADSERTAARPLVEDAKREVVRAGFVESSEASAA